MRMMTRRPTYNQSILQQLIYTRVLGKNMGKIMALTSFLMCLASCTPQTEFEVATWRGFKQCAVTFAFEDSYTNQFTKALPMFYEYDYPCSFFVCTKWCNQKKWDALREATAKGFEVGSHTVEHAVYDTLSYNEQRQDILDANARINVKIPMYRCNTLAYSNCVVGDTNLVKKHYFAAKGCAGYIEPKSPRDYYNISSLICGEAGAVNSFEQFKRSFETTKTTGGWCIFTVNEIDHGTNPDSSGYSSLSSSILRESLQYLKDQEKSYSYWVATFKDVAKYAKERDHHKIEVVHKDSTAKAINPDKIVVRLTLTDGLDSETYDCPLTLRCLLPFGWHNIEVFQKEKVINHIVKPINGCKYIIFDAVPDKGDIYIINLD